MRRSLIVIIIVAAVSALIARAERVTGSESGAAIFDAAVNNQSAGRALPSEWVRTADGWQPRSVLAPQITSQPLGVHPALVAVFELGASLLVLLAFPGRAVPVSAAAALRR